MSDLALTQRHIRSAVSILSVFCFRVLMGDSHTSLLHGLYSFSRSCGFFQGPCSCTDSQQVTNRSKRAVCRLLRANSPRWKDSCWLVNVLLSFPKVRFFSGVTQCGARMPAMLDPRGIAARRLLGNAGSTLQYPPSQQLACYFLVYLFPRGCC
jgi:hypothetical protein